MYEIEILLIDDNPTDIQHTREIFNQNKLKNNLNIVTTWVEAMAFLRHEIAVPPPDLILLDGSFSQNTEQRILVAIKDDANLRDIPLLIMAPVGSKPLFDDRLLAPNGFVNKPFDFMQFISVIKTIQSFKVAIVTTV